MKQRAPPKNICMGSDLKELSKYYIKAIENDWKQNRLKDMLDRTNFMYRKKNWIGPLPF